MSDYGDKIPHRKTNLISEICIFANLTDLDICRMK